MKHAYADLNDGEFNTILYQLTKYLRHQQNLITEIQSTCPKATTTRRTAMGGACKWLLENRVQVLQYIVNDKETQLQAPPG